MSLTSIYDKIWSPTVSSGTPPNNPIEGDIYYDTTKMRNYLFTNGVWKELTVSLKQPTIIKKQHRKNSIDKIWNR